MTRAATPQRLAIPAYFTPGPCWTRLNAAANAVGIAVINPRNGPGGDALAAYDAPTQQSRARGIAVIGYVDTGYAARPKDDVCRDIAAYATGCHLDGIFLDQVSIARADQRYYAAVADTIKVQSTEALIVLNPGVSPPEAMMAFADIVVTFENIYDAYTGAYATARWMRRYPPERFWHLIYGAPTMQAMRRAMALSTRRRAGWVYVTPDTLPNPWSALPADPYWAEELAAIRRTEN
ncbi:MAG: spherulation-specific family 4 protein [Thermomicrobia bacterium]|nr:spherulation-specific family 4 protein [Thermomicrobia bacterium]